MSSRPLLPVDPALPIGEVLIDSEAVRPLVEDFLGAAVERLRIRYLDLRPGRRLVVQYAATVRGEVENLAVLADPHGHRFFRRAEDPGLPVLGEPEALAALTGQIAEPSVLAWVPTQRAALAIGPTIAKVYAEEAEAVDAFDRLQRVHAFVATARPLALDRARRTVVQERLDGRPLGGDDAWETAPAARRLLEHLQQIPFEALPRLDAAAVLGIAAAPMALVQFADAGLGKRLVAARDVLVDRIPDRAATAIAHGDFNAGQLIEQHDGRLAVVDVDTLCVAAPAFDIASFATNVVSGRVDDHDRASAILDRITADASEVPDLGWYVAATLLRRVDRAIRRLKRDWPERTERLVAAVEGALDRV